MITALIIDDETDGRESLSMALAAYCPDIDLKGVYGNPEEGIAAIKNERPDLLFLDVQMPHMSGFDVLQKLSPVDFQVIFVSAHDRYAIKAIKFSALDYLLKPVDIDDLIHAVQKVKEKVEAKDRHHQYQAVLHNIRQKSERIERIAIPTVDGIDFFNTGEIIFCRAEGNYTTLILQDKHSCVVSRNLKDFENLLGDSGFCRVHHSYLVNLAHVKRYVRGEGGYVILSGDHHVDISRRKKDEFLALLDKL
jgi:two-component system LytT family response regulator